MLRIHHVGLARPDPEELGVEAVGVLDRALCPDIRRVGQQLLVNTRLTQFLDAEVPNTLAAGNKLLPQLLDVGGTGKAPGHADDGDARPEIQGITHSLLLALRWSSDYSWALSGAARQEPAALRRAMAWRRTAARARTSDRISGRAEPASRYWERERTVG